MYRDDSYPCVHRSLTDVFSSACALLQCRVAIIVASVSYETTACIKPGGQLFRASKLTIRKLSDGTGHNKMV